MKMILISTVILSLANVALAAPTDIKINSFHRLDIGNSQNTTAEVCGTVIGTLNGTEKILVTADPGDHQGEYMTTPSPKGNFCQLISAYYQVEVRIINQANNVLAQTSQSLR